MEEIYSEEYFKKQKLKLKLIFIAVGILFLVFGIAFNLYCPLIGYMLGFVIGHILFILMKWNIKRKY